MKLLLYLNVMLLLFLTSCGGKTRKENNYKPIELEEVPEPGDTTPVSPSVTPIPPSVPPTKTPTPIPVEEVVDNSRLLSGNLGIKSHTNLDKTPISLQNPIYSLKVWKYKINNDEGGISCPANLSSYSTLKKENGRFFLELLNEGNYVVCFLGKENDEEKWSLKNPYKTNIVKDIMVPVVSIRDNLGNSLNNKVDQDRNEYHLTLVNDFMSKVLNYDGKLKYYRKIFTITESDRRKGVVDVCKETSLDSYNEINLGVISYRFKQNIGLYALCVYAKDNAGNYSIFNKNNAFFLKKSVIPSIQSISLNGKKIENNSEYYTNEDVIKLDIKYKNFASNGIIYSLIETGKECSKEGTFLRNPTIPIPERELRKKVCITANADAGQAKEIWSFIVNKKKTIFLDQQDVFMEGLPDSTTDKSYLEIKVKSDSLLSYEYKYGIYSELDCTESESYIKENPLDKKIIIDMPNATNDRYGLCLRGYDIYGNYLSDALVYKWGYIGGSIDYDFVYWNKNAKKYFGKEFIVKIKADPQYQVEKLKVNISNNSNYCLYHYSWAKVVDPLETVSFPWDDIEDATLCIWAKVNSVWQSAELAYAMNFKWYATEVSMQDFYIQGDSYINKDSEYKVVTSSDNVEMDKEYKLAFKLLKLGNNCSQYKKEMIENLSDIDTYKLNVGIRSNAKFTLCALICVEKNQCGYISKEISYRNKYKHKGVNISQIDDINPLEKVEFEIKDEEVGGIKYYLLYNDNNECKINAKYKTVETINSIITVSLDELMLKSKERNYITICYHIRDKWGNYSEIKEYTWLKDDRSVKFELIEIVNGFRGKNILRMKIFNKKNIQYYKSIVSQNANKKCEKVSFAATEKKYDTNKINLTIPNNFVNGDAFVCLQLCNRWEQCRTETVHFKVDKVAPKGKFKLESKINKYDNRKFIDMPILFEPTTSDSDIKYYKVSYTYGENAECKNPAHLSNTSIENPLNLKLEYDGKQLICLFAVDDLGNSQTRMEATLIEWIKDTQKPWKKVFAWSSVLQERVYNKLNAKDLDFNTPLVDIARFKDQHMNEVSYAFGTTSCEEQSNWTDKVPLLSEIKRNIEGKRYVCVKATDLAGNIQMESISFLFDVIEPTIDIEYPLSGSTVNDLFITLRAKSNETTSFDVIYDRPESHFILKNETEEYVYFKDGRLKQFLHLTPVSGERKVTLYAYDEAGNMSKPVSVTFYYEPNHSLFQQSLYPLSEQLNFDWNTISVFKGKYVVEHIDDSVRIYQRDDAVDNMKLVKNIQAKELVLRQDRKIKKVIVGTENLMLLVGGKKEADILTYSYNGGELYRNRQLDYKFKLKENSRIMDINSDGNNMVVLQQENHLSKDHLGFYLFKKQDEKWIFIRKILHELVNSSYENYSLRTNNLVINNDKIALSIEEYFKDRKSFRTAFNLVYFNIFDEEKTEKIQLNLPQAYEHHANILLTDKSLFYGIYGHGKESFWVWDYQTESSTRLNLPKEELMLNERIGGRAENLFDFYNGILALGVSGNPSKDLGSKVTSPHNENLDFLRLILNEYGLFTFARVDNSSLLDFKMIPSNSSKTRQVDPEQFTKKVSFSDSADHETGEYYVLTFYVDIGSEAKKHLDFYFDIMEKRYVLGNLRLTSPLGKSYTLDYSRFFYDTMDIDNRKRKILSELSTEPSVGRWRFEIEHTLERENWKHSYFYIAY